jgi:hypothetical protein
VDEKLEESTQTIVVTLIELHLHHLENDREEKYPQDEECHKWLQINY